jgi:hypothetical protein
MGRFARQIYVTGGDTQTPALSRRNRQSGDKKLSAIDSQGQDAIGFVVGVNPSIDILGGNEAGFWIIPVVEIHKVDAARLYRPDALW